MEIIWKATHFSRVSNSGKTETVTVFVEVKAPDGFSRKYTVSSAEKPYHGSRAKGNNQEMSEEIRDYDLPEDLRKRFLDDYNENIRFRERENALEKKRFLLEEMIINGKKLRQIIKDALERLERNGDHTHYKPEHIIYVLMAHVFGITVQWQGGYNSYPVVADPYSVVLKTTAGGADGRIIYCFCKDHKILAEISVSESTVKKIDKLFHFEYSREILLDFEINLK